MPERRPKGQNWGDKNVDYKIMDKEYIKARDKHSKHMLYAISNLKALITKILLVTKSRRFPDT